MIAGVAGVLALWVAVAAAASTTASTTASATILIPTTPQTTTTTTPQTTTAAGTLETPETMMKQFEYPQTEKARLRDDSYATRAGTVLYRRNHYDVASGDHTSCVSYTYARGGAVTRNYFSADEVYKRSDQLNSERQVVQLTCSLPSDFFSADNVMLVSNTQGDLILTISSSQLHKDIGGVTWPDSWDKDERVYPQGPAVQDVLVCLDDKIITFTTFTSLTPAEPTLVFTPSDWRRNQQNLVYCQSGMMLNRAIAVRDTSHHSDCVYPILVDEPMKDADYLKRRDVVIYRCPVIIDPTNPLAWSVEVFTGSSDPVLLMHCYRPWAADTDVTRVRCQFLSRQIQRAMYCEGTLTIERYGVGQTERVFTQNALGLGSQRECLSHLSWANKRWENLMAKTMAPVPRSVMLEKVELACGGVYSGGWIPNVTWELRSGSETVVRCEIGLDECYHSNYGGASAVMVTELDTVDVCDSPFTVKNELITSRPFSRTEVRAPNDFVDVDEWMCPQIDVNRPVEIRSMTPVVKPAGVEQSPILKCDFDHWHCSHASTVYYIRFTRNKRVSGCADDLTFETSMMLGQLTAWYPHEEELATLCVRTLRELRSLRPVDPTPMGRPLTTTADPHPWLNPILTAWSRHAPVYAWARSQADAMSADNNTLADKTPDCVVSCSRQVAPHAICQATALSLIASLWIAVGVWHFVDSRRKTKRRSGFQSVSTTITEIRAPIHLASITPHHNQQRREHLYSTVNAVDLDLAVAAADDKPFPYEPPLSSSPLSPQQCTSNSSSS